MINNKEAILELVKESAIRLNPIIARNQLTTLAKKAIGISLANKGWKYEIPKAKVEEGGTGYVYAAPVKFQRVSKREYTAEAYQKQLQDIERKLYSGARRFGWGAERPTNESGKIIWEGEKKEEPASTAPIKLPEDIAHHFSHIFDRDAQIRLIHDAIKSAVESNWHKRNHCLLWGRPACGKTETLLAFERLLGKNAVVKLDATNTTKAGAEKLLLEIETIPPILIIEEIEKCNPVNLPWLLGVLDQRGEIIKTNARVGSMRREARCLCLATVNNLAEFNLVMSGALASRFQHKVYFPRPSRAILEKILMREVKEINGKVEWISPALDYCLDVEKTDDPRRVVAVLDGKDRLLSGEYQADLKAVHSAMIKDMGEEYKATN